MARAIEAVPQVTASRRPRPSRTGASPKPFIAAPSRTGRWKGRDSSTRSMRKTRRTPEPPAAHFVGLTLTTDGGAHRHGARIRTAAGRRVRDRQVRARHRRNRPRTEFAARAPRPRTRTDRGPPAPSLGRGGAWRVAAFSGVISQGLSRGSRQQVNASRPVGFSALRRLAKLRAGSAKNITPKREIMRSAHSPLRSWIVASATRNCAGEDSAAARSLARAIIGAEISTPSARPEAPVTRATASVVAPQPQPTSMTRSPGAAPADFSRRSVTGARTPSCISCRSIQRRPPGPFQ